MEYRPMVVAHRGLWFGRFVENSRQAFEAAERAGFPAECDVWKSAEGEPVVIHDSTLDRTTSGRGLVNACTTTVLKQLDVPLLADVAHLVHLVEIKPDDDRDLVQRVIERMKGQRWLLQSFDPRNLRHARRIDSSIPLALLIDDTSRIEEAFKYGWSVHANHELIDQAMVDRLRENGLRLGAWTVNAEQHLLRHLPFRPDVIISDHPQLMLENLQLSGIEHIGLVKRGA